MMNDQQVAHLRSLEIDGRITPEAVVNDASNPDSPLHELFEWDTAKAAHKHWMDRARTLIRSVEVVMRNERITVSTVAYVHDPSLPPKQQGYIAIERLRTDEDLAREAIVTEFKRVAGALQRARNIATALQVQEEIDSLIAGVDAFKA